MWRSKCAGYQRAGETLAGWQPLAGLCRCGPDRQHVRRRAGHSNATYQHGDDFSADRQRIEAGLMERLNPSLAVERNKYEQQLADQGIRYGSPAYENAMRNYAMQANDARLAVIGRAARSSSGCPRWPHGGEFANKGQQQAYEQARGWRVWQQGAAASLRTIVRARSVWQCRAAAGLFAGRPCAAPLPMRHWRRTSSRAQSAFNATNAARQQYLNEQFALRNQPINEITALLSGSQVQQPNFLIDQSCPPSRPPTSPD